MKGGKLQMQMRFELPDPNQGEFDFEQVVGEIPPYRLQLIKDTGAVASSLAERGKITGSTADDIVNCMSIWVFANRTL